MPFNSDFPLAKPTMALAGLSTRIIEGGAVAFGDAEVPL